MATSGSIDFVVSRDELITDALITLGAIAEGDTPSADQLTQMSRMLNMMAKAWQANGLNLFALQKVFLFLDKDKREYPLSNTATTHATSSYVQTGVKVAGVSTDTTIDVDDITGISNGDNIGIHMDDNTLHWDTVNGAPSGDTVTLTTGLPGDVAVGRTVFTYTVKSNRPMKIYNSVIRTRDTIDIPVDVITRQEYIDLSVKNTNAQINQIYYDPQIGAGTLYTWPRADDVSDVLVLWVQRTLEDFDAGADTPDFPQEWYLPLMLGLAKIATPKYGTDSSETRKIAALAQEYYDMADGWDQEDYVLFEPDHRGYDD